MSKNEKHLGLRINRELHHKFFYIADYEGRSGNGQLLYLIRKCVDEFEKIHGKIEVPPEESDPAHGVKK